MKFYYFYFENVHLVSLGTFKSLGKSTHRHPPPKHCSSTWLLSSLNNVSAKIFVEL
jgi:hypothetical protein